jgi:HAD superfamily hydrolase (TIGR01509 family)
MKLMCIIFDFDRTLVNLSNFVDWQQARKLIIQSYLKHGTPESLIIKLGKGGFYNLLVKMPEELLKYMPPQKVKKIQSVVYDVLGESEAKGIRSSELMPGCLEVLHWLKNKGIKIGIASSNSDRVIKEIVRLHNLKPFIDDIVARNILYRMKPNPDQFLLCIKKFGCKLQNSVVVGDSRWDMVAAKKAGIFAIGVSTGSATGEELLAVGSKKIIKSLYELPGVLLNLDPSLADT